MAEIIQKILPRIFLYACFAWFIFTLFMVLLYSHPKRTITPIVPGVIGLKYEDINFKTKDGVSINGWFIPNKSSRTAVIACHGYPMDKGDILDLVSFLAARHNLLLFDFRGMGKSGGFLSTGGTKETMDINAAAELLSGKGFKKIGGFGFSMGASAMALNDSPLIKAKVLDSPFADLGSQLEHIFRDYRLFKWPIIWGMRFWGFILTGKDLMASNPEDAAATNPSKLLIIAGDKDSVVPHDNAMNIKKAAPNAELWIIKGADHGQAAGFAGSEYEKRILAFFDRAFAQGPQDR